MTQLYLHRLADVPNDNVGDLLQFKVEMLDVISPYRSVAAFEATAAVAESISLEYTWKLLAWLCSEDGGRAPSRIPLLASGTVGSRLTGLSQPPGETNDLKADKRGSTPSEMFVPISSGDGQFGDPGDLDFFSPSQTDRLAISNTKILLLKPSNGN